MSCGSSVLGFAGLAVVEVAAAASGAETGPERPGSLDAVLAGAPPCGEIGVRLRVWDGLDVQGSLAWYAARPRGGSAHAHVHLEPAGLVDEFFVVLSLARRGTCLYYLSHPRVSTCNTCRSVT